jgi:thioredoxin-related protein
MKSLLILFLLTIPYCGISASHLYKLGVSPADSSKINWITIEEAYVRSRQEPKKIFIKVYTDWCGWCKKMDKITFTDPAIINYINENFYAVRLNAEDKKSITLAEKTFAFDAATKTHELAQALLQGKISYPTTVYLDEDFNMLAPITGYLEVSTLDQLLHFYGENHYENTPWEQFIKNYQQKTISPK